MTTDSQGKVISAKMKLSTGSQILDDHTTKCALNWHGPPNSTKAISIGYELVNNISRPSRGLSFTPIPPYPYLARFRGVHGSGVVCFVADASGKAAQVSMKQSTGSEMLDASTIKYAREHWRGQRNQTFYVPITYQLHR